MRPAYMTPERAVAIRLALDKTQDELATMLHLHRRTVQKFEAGIQPIPGPVAELLELWDAQRVPDDPASCAARARATECYEGLSHLGVIVVPADAMVWPTDDASGHWVGAEVWVPAHD